jgi:hypothetical protein
MTETKTETDRPHVQYGDLALAERNLILRTLVGSGVHGIAIEGTDDRDEMGVFIEPIENVIGTAGDMSTVTYRTKPEGVRSGPGDLDLSLYSLRKYISLAAKGNPTALLPLGRQVRRSCAPAGLPGLRDLPDGSADPADARGPARAGAGGQAR